MARIPITLGPVPCQGCRRFVAYVYDEWRDATPERQRTYAGHRISRIAHRCPALTEKERAALRLGASLPSRAA